MAIESTTERTTFRALFDHGRASRAEVKHRLIDQSVVALATLIQSCQKDRDDDRQVIRELYTHIHSLMAALRFYADAHQYVTDAEGYCPILGDGGNTAADILNLYDEDGTE